MASNKSISILSELKTISANVPFIPLAELLKWATLNGAEFLKISDKYGSLEKGKSPGILLLENVNCKNMQLRKEASVKILIG